METNSNEVMNMLNEGTVVVKELEARVYFETLPLMNSGAALVPGRADVLIPSAVLGVRG